MDRKNIAENLYSLLEDMNQQESVTYLAGLLYCVQGKQLEAIEQYVRNVPEELKLPCVDDFNRFTKKSI